MPTDISRIVTVTVSAPAYLSQSERFNRAPINEATTAKIANAIGMLEYAAKMQGFATPIQIEDYNALLEQFTTCKRTMMEAYRRG